MLRLGRVRMIWLAPLQQMILLWAGLGLIQGYSGRLA